MQLHAILRDLNLLVNVTRKDLGRLAVGIPPQDGELGLM